VVNNSSPNFAVAAPGG
jgi:hypothetical protein